MSDYVYYGLSIFCVCLQSCSLMAVLFKTFPVKIFVGHKKELFTFCCISFGLWEEFAFYKCQGFTMYFFSVFMLLMIFSLLFFDGWLSLKNIICLILIIYRALLVPVADAVAIFTLQDGIQPLSGFPHLFSQILVAVLLIPLAIFLIKFKIIPTKRNSPTLAMISTVLMGSITLTLLLLVQTLPDSVKNVWYNICLIAVVSICYYTIYKLILSFYRELDYSIEIEYLKYEKEYENTLEDIYQNLKKLRHDFKNHILCMQLMLKQQEYQNLQDYCQELSENIYSAKQNIDTGNLTANVILNQKYLCAVSQNIKISITASLPRDIIIKKTDLCALISNLFDNALEASVKESDPWINIEIKPIKDYLFFLFSNKTSQFYKAGEKRFETQKSDKDSHGLGLKIVEEIVQKYDGIININTSENIFSVKIMIRPFIKYHKGP